MERFTDRKQLFCGCSIVFIERGEAACYEYLMTHPKNRLYVLALNHTTQNADCIKIADMKKRNCFVGHINSRFVYETMAEQLRERLRYIESFIID